MQVSILPQYSSFRTDGNSANHSGKHFLTSSKTVHRRLLENRCLVTSAERRFI